jgi:hypothetical protein
VGERSDRALSSLIHCIYRALSYTVYTPQPACVPALYVPLPPPGMPTCLSVGAPEVQHSVWQPYGYIYIAATSLTPRHAGWLHAWAPMGGGTLRWGHRREERFAMHHEFVPTPGTAPLPVLC